MDEDITLNPENNSDGMLEMQREEISLTHDAEPYAQQQMQMQAAVGVECPNCGAMNEPEAVYCASCGYPIGKTACPNCGAELDPDADFCESCRRYIRQDVCSFCGASLSGNDAFCPECGSPRGGIICPVCHTLNDFSFCKQCGTPLTEEARQLMVQIHELPEFKELQQLATDLQQLEQSIPYSSERDILKDQRNIKLRERVLSLLAQDRGVSNPVIPDAENKRLSVSKRLQPFLIRWYRCHSPNRLRYATMRWLAGHTVSDWLGSATISTPCTPVPVVVLNRSWVASGSSLAKT